MKNFMSACRTLFLEALSLYGSATDVEKNTGVKRQSISAWASGKQRPRADQLGKLADFMGWGLVKLGVCADARLEAAEFVMTNGALGKKVDLSEYEAIPLIDDPDIIQRGQPIPNSHILHYAIIHKSTPMLSACSPHLIGVSVLESSIGTFIEKSDTVIFDLDDTEIVDGRVYLVRTPEGKTYIRRVTVSGSSDDLRFTFYSQNHNVPSMAFTLAEYNGDTSKVIIGRGVWFRGDLKNL